MLVRAMDNRLPTAYTPTMRLATRISLVVLLGVNVLLAQENVAERENINTAISDGIRLLEAREYTEFLKRYVAPADLERLIKTTSLEDFSREFSGSKASRLLEVLKLIQGKKPDADSSGTSATFQLQSPIGGKSSITFVRIEKNWYIQN